MLSMLQEFSRNVDTISLAPPHKPHSGESLSKLKTQIEEPLTVGSVCCSKRRSMFSMYRFYSSLSLTSLQIFDGEYQHGNKPISQSGSSRLRDFAQWAIDRPEKAIVVTGISISCMSISLFLSSYLGLVYDGV